MRVVPVCNAHLLTFCSCAHCWQDIACSFNSLGIIDVRKDESICDAFGAFVTVLFGAFDAVLVSRLLVRVLSQHLHHAAMVLVRQWDFVSTTTQPASPPGMSPPRV